MMCVRCATCATRDACGPHIHNTPCRVGARFGATPRLLQFCAITLFTGSTANFYHIFTFIRLSRDKRANIARATYKTSLVLAPHSFCRFSYSFTDAANSLALRPAPGEHATCLAAHTPPKLSSDTKAREED